MLLYWTRKTEHNSSFPFYLEIQTLHGGLDVLSKTDVQSLVDSFLEIILEGRRWLNNLQWLCSWFQTQYVPLGIPFWTLKLWNIVLLQGYFLLHHMGDLVGLEQFNCFLFNYVQHFKGQLVTSEVRQQLILCQALKTTSLLWCSCPSLLLKRVNALRAFDIRR